jgi:hypothetical protein
VRNRGTVAELLSRFGCMPAGSTDGRRACLTGSVAMRAWESQDGARSIGERSAVAFLYKMIGPLTVEQDFFAQDLGREAGGAAVAGRSREPASDDPDAVPSAAGRAPDTVASAAPVSTDELWATRRPNEQYLDTPVYGPRRVVAMLRRNGWAVDRKQVRCANRHR